MHRYNKETSVSTSYIVLFYQCSLLYSLLSLSNINYIEFQTKSQIYYRFLTTEMTKNLDLFITLEIKIGFNIPFFFTFLSFFLFHQHQHPHSNINKRTVSSDKMTASTLQTHLNSPLAWVDKEEGGVDFCAFTVEFASRFRLECRVQREEVLQYIFKNPLHEGDQVEISGSIITVSTDHTYMQVSSLKYIGHTASDEPKKKRKIDLLEDVDALTSLFHNIASLSMASAGSSSSASASSATAVNSKGPTRRSSTMSIASGGSSSPSITSRKTVTTATAEKTPAQSGNYYEWLHEDRQYIFTFYGEAHGIKERIEAINLDKYGELHKDCTSMMKLVMKLFNQLFKIFTEIEEPGGLNDLNVDNFVRTATSIVEKLYKIHKALLPFIPFPGTFMEPHGKIPLPKHIFNYYFEHCQ